MMRPRDHARFVEVATGGLQQRSQDSVSKACPPFAVLASGRLRGGGSFEYVPFCNAVVLLLKAAMFWERMERPGREAQRLARHQRDGCVHD